jgi:hypothetical protein
MRSDALSSFGTFQSLPHIIIFLYHKTSSDAAPETNSTEQGEAMSENSTEPAANEGEKQGTPKKQEEPKPAKKKKPTTKTVDLKIEHFVSSLSQVDLNKVVEREVGTIFFINTC